MNGGRVNSGTETEPRSAAAAPPHRRSDTELISFTWRRGARSQAAAASLLQKATSSPGAATCFQGAEPPLEGTAGSAHSLAGGETATKKTVLETLF